MARFRSTYFFFLFGIVLIAGFSAACTRAKDLPVEPVINSLSFDAQTKQMVVDFSDGDGDFGISPTDPDFPEYLDSDSTQRNPYYYNLWIDYFEKREGEWVRVETPGSFNFRIPVLTPEGQNKQLEVTVTNDLSFDLPLPTAESDTIKFKVTLVDRAKHESVPEETDAIYLPQ